MALPESSLSIVCKSVYDFVGVGVGAAVNDISMTMGAPGEDTGESGKNRINLFFYRFEPGGFDSVSHPFDPWRIRMFCLITTFGVGDTDVSAGDNELRMLGEVIRVFREKPLLDAVGVGGEQVRLQAVFSPISDEQINQIWSTQGEVNYRPSVIYELALTPIMPSRLRVEPARVGAIGMEARGAISARYDDFNGSVQGPPVARHVVSTANPQWIPHLCWVHQGVCGYSFSFDITSPEFAAFSSAIWLAGDPGEDVDLVWEIWDAAGWRSVGAPITVQPFSSEIDPDNLPSAPGFPLAVANPITVPAGQNAAQGMLYATRQVVLTAGQPAVEIRSNPLLLSLYRPAP